MDSPLVLSMCDTLLQRSEESGDKHMQIISYCIKLDYFYYKNDEENILKQTDEVKKVCLRLDNLKGNYILIYTNYVKTLHYICILCKKLLY